MSVLFLEPHQHYKQFKLPLVVKNKIYDSESL